LYYIKVTYKRSGSYRLTLTAEWSLLGKSIIHIFRRASLNEHPRLGYHEIKIKSVFGVPYERMSPSASDACEVFLLSINQVYHHSVFQTRSHLDTDCKQPLCFSRRTKKKRRGEACRNLPGISPATFQLFSTKNSALLKPQLIEQPLCTPRS